MMFESANGRIGREAQEFEDDLQSYHDMALDIFAVQQIERIDAEAAVNSRHVTTANDRYQMTVVGLELAYNRFTVARSLYDCGTSSEGLEAARNGEISYPELHGYTENLFLHAKTLGDAATATWSNVDYKASRDDDECILRTAGENVLPGNADSPWILKAGINALDTLYVQAYTRYTDTMGNALLPNGFKLKLGRDAGSLLHAMEDRRASILRAASGDITTVRNRNIIASVRNEVAEGLAAADRLAVWLSAPRLYDESFTLNSPLDEHRPQGRRSFNPQTLASSLVQTEVEVKPEPDQPRRISKPFIPDDLVRSRAEPDPKPEIGQLRPPRRTFDPKHLEAPRRRRRFDPKDLD